MDKRYQVFVSSTYADLKEERRSVIQALMDMDCIPAGMELFPAADEEQFQFIKKIIDDCDYYVLIIGGRYGSTTAEGKRTYRLGFCAILLLLELNNSSAYRKLGFKGLYSAPAGLLCANFAYLATLSTCQA